MLIYIKMFRFSNSFLLKQFSNENLPKMSKCWDFHQICKMLISIFSWDFRKFFLFLLRKFQKQKEISTFSKFIHNLKNYKFRFWKKVKPFFSRNLKFKGVPPFLELRSRHSNIKSFSKTFIKTAAPHNRHGSGFGLRLALRVENWFRNFCGFISSNVGSFEYWSSSVSGFFIKYRITYDIYWDSSIYGSIERPPFLKFVGYKMFQKCILKLNLFEHGLAKMSVSTWFRK